MRQFRPFGRFSAQDRIRKRSEFRRFQDSAHRVVSPGFVFLLGCSGAGGRRRLGITASRRVGNAVERNRAKRLVREAFRALREQLPTGLALVVIVRHGLGSRKLADVIAEWQANQARIARRFAQMCRETREPAAPAVLPSGDSC